MMADGRCYKTSKHVPILKPPMFRLTLRGGLFFIKMRLCFVILEIIYTFVAGFEI